MQRFWLLLLATAWLALGQQTATRTVTGIVTNSVTGEPISRALVVFFARGGQHSAFTGADGRFSLDGVPAQAQIFLNVQKPGFSNTNSAVVQGEARVSLMPDGKITGRALDPDGEPIGHLPVQLLVSQIIQGRRSWMPRQFALTDEEGAYSLPSLPAGRYVLHTLIQPLPATAPDAPALVYAPRYYPGAADLSSAQAIQVTAGQESTINLSLQPERAFRVSGSIAGSSRSGPAALLLTDADGQQISLAGNMVDQHTGKFMLDHMPSGSWSIALGNSEREEFTVNGADVSGLQILPQEPVTIPVILKHSSGPAAQVHLVPRQGNVRANYFSQQDGRAPADTEPHLVINNVPPGRYGIVVASLGSQCVSSVVAGSTDLTRDDLLIAPGSQPEPITIDLEGGCATVTGTTTSSGGKSAHGFALAVPESAPSGAKFTAFVEGQSFSLTGLSPGSYRIYAFTNLDDLEYANPEALREYRGQQVDLQAGQNASVTLEVIQREHP